MRSKLKERFARLGPVQAVDRVASGSPADLILRPSNDGIANVIAAALALARRGVTMLRAKRALEAAIESGETVVHVPTVEDTDCLARDLLAAGFRSARIASGSIDIRTLRERLGLTQEQFSLRFNLDLNAVQNWEQGRRQPDRAVQSYLRVIATSPDTAARAQEEGHS